MTLARAAALVLITHCAIGQPHLILHGFYKGPKPTPTFVRDNLQYLESLPFDGYAVYMRDPYGQTNITASAFTPEPLSYYSMMQVLAPMNNLPYRNIKDNFGLIYAGEAIDVFDERLWFIRTQNMRNLARALRTAGLKGIFFDNENYSDWAHYGGTACPESRTLWQCQEQMRLRGRQIMQALVDEFPDIVMICLIGPWVSDNTFYERSGLTNIARANALSGPFFVGLVEAKGELATVVDGGEFYNSRTIADFATRYHDQKFGLPSADNVPIDNQSRAAGPNGFIPQDLRNSWASKVSASAGIYDRDTGMTPATLQTAIKNALSCVDRYAWLYTEAFTFFAPPGTDPAAAPREWLEAVRVGRTAPRTKCAQQ